MRLRFTIRDLLWLTLVVALAVGWWLDRRSIQRQSAAEFSVPIAQAAWPFGFA